VIFTLLAPPGPPIDDPKQKASISTLHALPPLSSSWFLPFSDYFFPTPWQLVFTNSFVHFRRWAVALPPLEAFTPSSPQLPSPPATPALIPFTRVNEVSLTLPDVRILPKQNSNIISWQPPPFLLSKSLNLSLLFGHPPLPPLFLGPFFLRWSLGFPTPQEKDPFFELRFFIRAHFIPSTLSGNSYSIVRSSTQDRQPFRVPINGPRAHPINDAATPKSSFNILLFFALERLRFEQSNFPDEANLAPDYRLQTLWIFRFSFDSLFFPHTLFPPFPPLLQSEMTLRLLDPTCTSFPYGEDSFHDPDAFPSCSLV